MEATKLQLKYLLFSFICSIMYTPSISYSQQDGLLLVLWPILPKANCCHARALWLLQESYFSWTAQSSLQWSKMYFRWLLVSGPAYKDLRSHHSILTISKLLNRLKNQLSLDLSENLGHRANCCSQNWRDRQIQRITNSAEIPKQKLTQESVSEWENLSCDWWIADSASSIHHIFYHFTSSQEGECSK